MQKYVDQLLQDIAAATRPPQPAGPGPDELDAYFEEVDRYLEEEPEKTLGQHCGLHTGQFPETDKLTEAQQQSLVEAMRELYDSYGICLDIPPPLPVSVQYPFYVAALDKRCFISSWGTTHIDYCGYTFEYCPFGEEHCTCMNDWLDEVEFIQLQPRSKWTEIEWMEHTWHQVITMLKRFREVLEKGNSPNKARVLRLLSDISLIKKAMHEGNGCIVPSIRCSPPPGATYRQLFEWMGLPPADFPSPDELTESELYALGFALAWLYGKGYPTVSLMQVSPTVRYVQLAGFFTSPMYREEPMFFILHPTNSKSIEVPDFLEQIGLGMKCPGFGESAIDE